MTSTFVSTSIPYVNAAPHVGFALELVIADTIARWHRLQGEDVFFLTGTDENALTNVRAAEQLGITPGQLCDRNAPLFEKLVSALGISADAFVRTSGSGHHAAVQKLWSSLRADDLSLRGYRGLYCVGCERFYEQEELSEGLCPTHRVPPEAVDEENHFFALSHYQSQLEAWLTEGVLHVTPASRQREALGSIAQGLRDGSVSRSRERSRGWGVPVPGDYSQTVYVWVDALTNYLSGLGYGSGAEAFARYWQGSGRRVHIIGKDILRFHAVLWPALLASAGLPLPTSVVVHGFLSVDGEKISKSRGNAVSPFPVIDKYGADVLRYYLLRAIPAGADGDYSESRLEEVYQADLANGLGNLVRRLETLCERAGFRTDGQSTPEATSVVRDATGEYQFQQALRQLWDEIAQLNRSIDRAKPWEALPPGESADLHRDLADWVRRIRQVGAGLRPFLPHTAVEIEQRFSSPAVKVGEVLFPRR